MSSCILEMLRNHESWTWQGNDCYLNCLIKINWIRNLIVCLSLYSQALICSCFIPIYCGLIPPAFRGVVSVEGPKEIYGVTWGYNVRFSSLGRIRTLLHRIQSLGHTEQTLPMNYTMKYTYCLQEFSLSYFAYFCVSDNAVEGLLVVTVKKHFWTLVR